MNNRLTFLKQLISHFHFRKDASIDVDQESYAQPSQEQPQESMGHHVDADKLETLLCLESLQDMCYQALAGLVHNQTVRKECQQFAEHVQYREDELRRIFPVSDKSEAVIQNKIEKYMSAWKPLQLPLRAVLNLASNLTTFKVDIYKHLSHALPEHHDILNHFLEANIEEREFLSQEKKFHQNRLDAYSDIH